MEEEAEEEAEDDKNEDYDADDWDKGENYRNVDDSSSRLMGNDVNDQIVTQPLTESTHSQNLYSQSSKESRENIAVKTTDTREENKVESPIVAHNIEMEFFLTPNISEDSNDEPETERECSQNIPDKENLKLTRKEKTKLVVSYVCDMCGKSYRRKTGLKRHVATFHKQEKCFRCERCDKTFGRLDSLVKHRLTHTQEKNLICEFCSRAFSQSSNLIKHRYIFLNQIIKKKIFF